MLSFKVKNLGRIAAASYTAAPLTLLIGQNNTGKSYLASLIWALARADVLLIHASSPDLPKWFADFASRVSKDPVAKQKVGSEHATELISFLERNINLRELLSRLYAFEGFDDATISFEISPDFEPFEITSTKPPVDAGAVSFSTTAFSVGGKESLRFRSPIRRRLSSAVPMNRILFECYGYCLFGSDWPSYRSPIYLPAARTGLMLALRSLIAQTLDFDDERPATLPLPISDFLSTLVRVGPQFEPTATSDWLESKILHGKLDVSDDEVPTFAYIPDRSNAKVPLHATSSMITEMAPFIHLIRYRENGHFIFEEPEAHLHLAAQRSIARAIARLLNAGARFTITTHSDTFVQQINNLMKLHSHPDREQLLKELDYEESDLIDPTDAKAYEFVLADGRTTIEELQRTEDGFIVPSLNETLISLSEETINLAENE